jgi:Cu(I)/Ag(I) efflux system membrane fusion protein
MRMALYATWLLIALVSGFLLGQAHNLQGKPGGPHSRRILPVVDPMHTDCRSHIVPDGTQHHPIQANKTGKLIVADTTGRGPDGVTLACYVQQRFGVRVAAAERTLETRILRIPGRVIAEETRVYRSSAGVHGFVKATYDLGSGSYIRKNHTLAIIYSHEFLTPISGYLSARDPRQGSTGGAASNQNIIGMKAWSDRLRSLGMSEIQIDELNSTGIFPGGIRIVSPHDGFIVARNISAGEKFDTNTEFYRIADLSQVWIVADLFETQARNVRAGSTARIQLPDQTRTVLGRVANILQPVDPATGRLNLRIEAENKGFALRPDMFVSVELSSLAEAALRVPADAVVDSGLHKRVYVYRGDGWFDAREVETGLHSGDRVEIIRGLKQTEYVARNASFLFDSEGRL